MMTKKRIFTAVLAASLVLPSFLVSAAANETTQKAEFAAKDEVVYATLSPTGKQQEIYVVNIFDVLEAGEIVDYGPYSSIKNLTDLSELQQVGNKVEIPASEGKFYYQGNMDEALPWDIAISYQLDGKKISPEELAGKEGHLEVRIRTSVNQKVNPVFFENYLLQVSLVLNPDIYSNIVISDDGMVANAGKNKQVTFTVMPENDGDLSLEADVVDFELQGIEISAVPSSMSIDAPETGEMIKDMKSLTDAIGQVNDGVAEFKNGVSKLNEGVTDLKNGSKQYQNGMAEISGASSELVNASASINGALEAISKGISENADQFDLSLLEDLNELKEIEDLPAGLTEIGNGLQEMADELTKLRGSYSDAYVSIEKAIEAIPGYTVTEEDIQKLYEVGADRAVVDRLVETHTAALKAKETYESVKQSFADVDAQLAEIIEFINNTGENMVSIAEGFSSSLDGMDILGSFEQLQEGLATMSSNYSQFHSGLVSYTNGVSQLAGSYNQLHSGIEELSGGTNELEKGAADLHDGTNELYESTNNLPEQMVEEIDKMIAEYDKSDFEAVSFVSDKNENVNSVQFVIKTESITIEEPETKEKAEEEEKGFWARLMDLFS